MQIKSLKSPSLWPSGSCKQWSVKDSLAKAELWQSSDQDKFDIVEEGFQLKGHLYFDSFKFSNVPVSKCCSGVENVSIKIICLVLSTLYNDFVTNCWTKVKLLTEYLACDTFLLV